MCLNKMSFCEMNGVKGGASTAEFLQALWNACPEQGQLTVTNQDDGSFGGVLPNGNYVKFVDDGNGHWVVSQFPIM